MKPPHDFRERLNFSEGMEVPQGILAHLYESIPGATEVCRANPDEDRHGTDWWILRDGLPPISVDMKHREFCPIERWGSDDACIETCSVFQNDERKKVGWTLDIAKRTDLIVYTWPHARGRRFWILWFPLLCRAAQNNWEIWAKKYKERRAQNDGYVTLSVYPTRQEIAAAIRSLTVGVA